MGFLLDSLADDKEKKPVDSIDNSEPAPFFDVEAEYQETLKREKARELAARQAENANAPARSWAGEIYTGLKTGITDVLPQMGAQALQAVAPEGSDLEKWAKKQADEQADDMTLPSHTLRPEQHGWLTNALAQGAQSLAPTVAVAGISAVSPWAGIPSAAILFGGSSYQQTYDEVLEKTGDKEAANNAGWKVGAIQGTADTLMSLLEVRFLKAGILGAGEKTVAKTLEKLKNPKAAMHFLKESGVMMASETSTEIAQDLASEAVTTRYTGDKPKYGQIIKDTGSATLGMTALMLPFGAIGHLNKTAANKKLLETVESSKAPPDQRLVAATSIFEQLESINEADAKAWAAPVFSAIAQDKDLDITNPSGFSDVSSPKQGIDKLKESLEIENAQLRGEIGARNERRQADAEQAQADAEQAQAGQLTQEDHVVPEPNDEGVIGPDYEVPKTTVEDLDQRIDRLQTRIDNNPNDPNIERVRAGLEQVKTERAKLLEKSTLQEATQENAESTAQTPLTPQQAVAELKSLGATEVVDGADRYWEVDTPDGPQVFEFSSPQDHAQILETVKGMQEQGQEENVAPEAAEGSTDTKSTVVPEATEQSAAEATEQSTAEATEQSAAEPAIEPIELSKPVDSREFKRDQETGHLVFKDAKTGTTVRMRYEKTGKNKGWYHVDPQGKETFIGATRKIAVENINKGIKQIENTSETKYSNIAEGDLIVDREAIPDDMEVETMVMTANTGQVAKTKFNAKKAIDSIESLQSKLKDILTCVGSD